MLLNGVQHPGAVPTKPFPAFGVSSPTALEQRSRTLAARSLLPLPYQPGAGFWLCLLRAQRPGSCADCQVGNHPFVTAWGGKAPVKLLPTSLRQLPGGLGGPDTEGLAHRLPAHVQRGAAEPGVLAPLRSRAPSPGSASSGQAERGSA